MLKSSFFLSVFLVLTLSCAGPANEKQVSQKRAPSPTPTGEELRLATEEQILKGDNHHDGSLTLAAVGTIESVPALLKVLEDNPPLPNGNIICTVEHATDALKKITGANPGHTYKKWKSWWDKYQMNQRRSNRSLIVQAQ